MIVTLVYVYHVELLRRMTRVVRGGGGVVGVL